MKYLLSIKTVVPRPGGRVWYDDQREAHTRILKAENAVDYDFMGTDPDAADNRLLREAMQYRVPVIYFLGISPGRYTAFLPTYIVGWDATSLKAQIAFGLDEPAAPFRTLPGAAHGGFADPSSAYVNDPGTERERRYALRSVKQRLHQASFREAVISAYRGRCALSGLPEPLLLDAAHIVRDQDEEFGQPIVANGLPLSKVHHAAFDAHLIGIDPDYRIHVADRLLHQHDGEMLQALKRLDGRQLHLPRREIDQPSRERLEVRFSTYKTVN